MSTLDEIIPGEIVDCDLAQWLTRLASREDVRTILEIGSSDGRGSTAAIVKGAKNRSYHPYIHCIEMSKVRFDALVERHKYVPRISFDCGLSVPVDDWMTEVDVIDFHTNYNTNLNKYSLDEVMGWLDKDLDYVVSNEHIRTHIIRDILRNFIVPPDLVLIDGGAFCAEAELELLMGSRIVVLDDVNCIKNYHNWKRLKSEPSYRLIHEDLTLRNGFSVHERL